MTEQTSRPVVVVGVEVDQPPVVLQQAALFATRLGARLVCGYADSAPAVLTAGAYGAMIAPVEPLVEAPVFPTELQHQLAAALPSDLDWDIALLEGPAAGALGALADSLDAVLIVVGTRQATMRGAVGEFFTGSIAVQLTHRQHRPVLVIPTHPTPEHQPLPWDATTGDN